MKIRNFLVVTFLLAFTFTSKGQFGLNLESENANVTYSFSVGNGTTYSSLNYKKGKKWKVISSDKGVRFIYKEGDCKLELFNEEIVFNNFDKEKTATILDEIKRPSATVQKLLANIEKRKKDSGKTFKINKEKRVFSEKIDDIKEKLDDIKVDLENIKPQAKRSLKETLDKDDDLLNDNYFAVDEAVASFKDRISSLQDKLDDFKEEQDAFFEEQQDDIIDEQKDWKEYLKEYYSSSNIIFLLLIIALFLFFNHRRNQRIQRMLKIHLSQGQEVTKKEDLTKTSEEMEDRR